MSVVALLREDIADVQKALVSIQTQAGSMTNALLYQRAQVRVNELTRVLGQKRSELAVAKREQAEMGGEEDEKEESEESEDEESEGAEEDESEDGEGEDGEDGEVAVEGGEHEVEEPSIDETTPPSNEDVDGVFEETSDETTPPSDEAGDDDDDSLFGGDDPTDEDLPKSPQMAQEPLAAAPATQEQVAAAEKTVAKSQGLALPRFALPKAVTPTVGQLTPSTESQELTSTTEKVAVKPQALALPRLAPPKAVTATVGQLTPSPEGPASRPVGEKAAAKPPGLALPHPGRLRTAIPAVQRLPPSPESQASTPVAGIAAAPQNEPAGTAPVGAAVGRPQLVAPESASIPLSSTAPLAGPRVASPTSPAPDGEPESGGRRNAIPSDQRQFLWKCRFGPRFPGTHCEHSFATDTSLRNHMERVHQLFPPTCKEVTGPCGNCGGKRFANMAGWNNHNCSINDKARRLWIPRAEYPRTMQEMADTWCLTQHGPPSESVKQLNKAWVARQAAEADTWCLTQHGPPSESVKQLNKAWVARQAAEAKKATQQHAEASARQQSKPARKRMAVDDEDDTLNGGQQKHPIISPPLPPHAGQDQRQYPKNPPTASARQGGTPLPPAVYEAMGMQRQYIARQQQMARQAELYRQQQQIAAQQQIASQQPLAYSSQLHSYQHGMGMMQYSPSMAVPMQHAPVVASQQHMTPQQRLPHSSQPQASQYGMGMMQQNSFMPSPSQHAMLTVSQQQMAPPQRLPHSSQPQGIQYGMGTAQCSPYMAAPLQNAQQCGNCHAMLTPGYPHGCRGRMGYRR